MILTFIAGLVVGWALFGPPLSFRHPVRNRARLETLLGVLFFRGFDAATARIKIGRWPSSSRTVILIRKDVVRDDLVRLALTEATGPLAATILRTLRADGAVEADTDEVGMYYADDSPLAVFSGPAPLAQSLAAAMNPSSAGTLAQASLALHDIHPKNVRIGWSQ